MNYGSVCSGIEAASVAWESLGWKASFFSEIEKFPRDVLTHHYPTVPLHGDFTTIQKEDYEPIELLVGGTPCQSFSVAGLREGLNDPRGNLMLEFGALADRLQPTILVWENVYGVLSSNNGKDFGSFLAMLGELGYGFAYRVLNSEYFGVPQRRRRVFVIGYLGDWRKAAAILFEQESLHRIVKALPEGKLRGRGKTTSGCACTRQMQLGRKELDTLIFDYEEKTVRIFTPEEYERLQGFPTGYTNVENATDTKRFKAIGNSMAVPVMKWIGERINLIEGMK